MEKNPYTLLFGKAPATLIPREDQIEMVVDAFCEEEINEQAYAIAGVRGSGKTVFMTEIAKRLKTEDPWIVVDLNAERNLLEDFVSALYSERRLAGFFQNARINLSFFGFGIDIQGASPITNIQVAAKSMLQSLRAHHKRVLVTIDEVTNSKSIREFAHAFQSFIREELPVFLLVTGLYENLNDLQNEKGSTFLYRMPRIEMEPLYGGFVADNYQRTFSLERDKAIEMANLTRGYPFAFQVLGYHTWKAGGEYTSVIGQYESYLDRYSYSKIWSELSGKDKTFAYGIARSKDGKIQEIREILNWQSNEISPYRERLKERGLVESREYGHVSFTLPLFGAFVIRKKEMGW